jgi:hypothetical protein
VSPGALTGDAANDVERLLGTAWGRLEGSHDGGMKGEKLVGRAESLHWSPPFLTFVIERHGAFVKGSTRAELQKWEIDVSRNTARIVAQSRRQLVAMDARLDVKPLTAEIAAMILRAGEAPALKWVNHSRVRVLTGVVIPKTIKQTTLSRRGRFVAELSQILRPEGWKRVAAGGQIVFEKAPSEAS